MSFLRALGSGCRASEQSLCSTTRLRSTVSPERTEQPPVMGRCMQGAAHRALHTGHGHLDSVLGLQDRMYVRTCGRFVRIRRGGTAARIGTRMFSRMSDWNVSFRILQWRAGLSHVNGGYIKHDIVYHDIVCKARRRLPPSTSGPGGLTPRPILTQRFIPHDNNYV